jgi:hypothetical protein
MAASRTSMEQQDPAVHRAEAARRYRLAAELFARDHAYAARLVQTATGVPGVRTVSDMGGTETSPATVISPGAADRSSG